MMADLRDKLRRQIGQAAPGALPGGSRAALDDKLRGSTQEEAQRAALYADVDVYLVTDATRSMGGPINAVAEGMSQISTEQLHHPERGDVRIGIWAVYDHDYRDLFCTFPLTSDPSTITSHIAHIRNLERNPHLYDADHAEAYECAWLQLAREISTPAHTQTGRKKVVAFMGDMFPHGLAKTARYTLPTYFRILAPAELDNGCPQQVDYRKAWRAMTTAADMTVFVGCADYSDSQYKGLGISAVQRTLVAEQDPKQKYVGLEQVGDIPAIVMAATRLAQSETAAREYFNRLALEDKGRATRIAGLLGTTKK